MIMYHCLHATVPMYKRLMTMSLCQTQDTAALLAPLRAYLGGACNWAVHIYDFTINQCVFDCKD